MGAGGGLMTRRKTKTGAAAPPTGEADRETIVNRKGSPESADWLGEIRRRTHTFKVQIVRLALGESDGKHGPPLRPEI